MEQDWLGMTAAALGRGIAEGSIGPVALTETYLAAIDAHPHRDRIYARVTSDRARAEASAAATRAKAGYRLSPLDGVPISWKDLFDTAGVATEAGSRLLEGRVPAADALVLGNATALGLVCLGKTHMTELAFSGLGYNPMTATPPCVNDVDAVPGGSSSGAAASVAFGIASAGIGSDSGGSVRVPSAWNDLVGLKTTWGRLSLDGVAPLFPNFDTVGPLCGSVEDAALLLAALEGGKAADLRGATLEGAQFLILDTVAFEDIRPAPLDGFEKAVERLRKAGAKIVHGEVPEVRLAMALSPTIFATEAYGVWKDVIEANPQAMFPQVLERFRGGKAISGPDYVSAMRALDGFKRSWFAATAAFDAVLVPTVPNMPPKAAAIAADPALFVAENLLALRNTRIGNLMGIPVLTLPTGVPSVGISLLGPPMGEERLLRLGAAAEAALA
jgi:aspartyl-tRNA(Asn)/glutamyl-tRNA(Gln) amidotransferase subunit A